MSRIFLQMAKHLSHLFVTGVCSWQHLLGPLTIIFSLSPTLRIIPISMSSLFTPLLSGIS